MWNVNLSKKCVRQIRSLPDSLKERLFSLFKEIECSGPVRGDWPNYVKLPENRHHCHIKKGKPTYVVVWQESGNQSVEVKYVGTHERAPY